MAALTALCAGRHASANFAWGEGGRHAHVHETLTPVGADPSRACSQQPREIIMKEAIYVFCGSFCGWINWFAIQQVNQTQNGEREGV